MNKRRFAAFGALALMLILSACAAQPTAPPVAPAAPVQPAEPPAVVATEVGPTVAAEVAVMPGPVMAVGSTYAYFDGSVLVAVPAGEFVMGGDGQDNPRHIVSLSDFWIYQVEVSNHMYRLCVDLGNCSPPDPKDNPIFYDRREGSKPVVGLNWSQASDYCGFVNGRLPTEAEWEKTMRGPDGNLYPWGNEAPTCNLLNFDACIHKTTFVGSYPQGESYYKALDGAGNVFEWVNDWYSANYYGAAPTQDPPGAASGSRRAVRSSAFNTDGYLTEVSRRFFAEIRQWLSPMN